MGRLGHRVTEAQRIVALLHDVPEDTQYTLADLQWIGYPYEVLAPLAELTRDKEEQTYWQYIHAIEHPTALLIKWHDIQDNLADSWTNGVDLNEMESMREKRWKPALEYIWDTCRQKHPEIERFLT